VNADLRPRTITPLAKWLIGRVADRQSIPRYASPAWGNLPDGDPRRAAAVLIAAEAWANHCSPWQVAQDLLAEMVDRDDDISRRLRETSWDVHAALYPHLWDVDAERIPHLPIEPSPSHAELAKRRRGEAA
jgi:hypothetical protein